MTTAQTQVEEKHSRAPAMQLLSRLARYAKPYIWVIVLSFAVSAVLAGGRYGRAYIMKPLLDDVLIPFQLMSSEDGRGEDLPLIPLESSPPVATTGSGDPITAVGVGSESEATAPLVQSRDEVERKRREVAPDVLVTLTMVALLLILIMPVATFWSAYLSEWVLGRIGVDLRTELAKKLLSVPLSFHRGGSTGDLLSRALNDAGECERAISLVLVNFLTAVVMVVAGFSTLLFISWQLALLSFCTAPLMVGILAFFSAKIRRGARRRQAQLGEVVQRLTSILSGIKVIKAFRGEGVEIAAFRNDTEMHFQRAMKVVKNAVLSRSLIDMLNNGSLIAILFIGAWLILHGHFDLTIGKLSSFAATMAITYKPLKVLSRGWAKLMDALASAERYFEVLDTPEEPADVKDAVTIAGVRESISFEHVSFSYGREPVLEDISLTVYPGEVIAIVGPTGGGKTTLVDLLLRFHESDRGSICIDGVDLRQIKRDSLLEHVSVVTQEPFLFDTTILENIRYGRPDASEADLIAAAEAAHVDEYVDQLIDGYDTQVGEFGMQLSGGQRQRITIARAILKQPAILVFDEATSSLDAKTERTVQEAINSLRGQRTIFIVAHRLSTIRSADRIVVIDRGKVAQLGTHEELFAQTGLYAELVNLQLSGHDVETRSPN